MNREQGDVTGLLKAYAQGDRSVFKEIFPVVYEELRRIARRRLRSERKDHTLGATALVHEGYLKLVRLEKVRWENRAHIFAIAAQAMRNILIDYAVKRKAQKRGAGREKLGLDEVAAIVEDRADELLALDEALKQLETFDARQSRVVECRVFAGLSIEETARPLQISEATVSRDWMAARAWLNRELSV